MPPATLELRGSADGPIVHPFDVSVDRVVIGRGEDADLAIDDPKVSRQHVLLLATERGYLVVEHQSRNGIWVGDRKVSHAFIDHGQMFRIGRSYLTLRVTSEDSAAASSAPTVVDEDPLPPAGQPAAQSPTVASAPAELQPTPKVVPAPAPPAAVPNVAPAPAEPIPAPNVAPALPAQVAPARRCERCLGPLDGGDRFCGVCGANTGPDARPRRRRSRPLLWLVLFLIVAAGSGAAWYYLIGPDGRWPVVLL